MSDFGKRIGKARPALDIFYRIQSDDSPKSQVYFAHCPKLDVIKIGNSCRPIQRVKGLQTGIPFELVLVDILYSVSEIAIHREFSVYKIRREWFHARPILRWLKALWYELDLEGIHEVLRIWRPDETTID